MLDAVVVVIIIVIIDVIIVIIYSGNNRVRSETHYSMNLSRTCLFSRPVKLSPLRRPSPAALARAAVASKANAGCVISSHLGRARAENLKRAASW